MDGSVCKCSYGRMCIDAHRSIIGCVSGNCESLIELRPLPEFVSRLGILYRHLPAVFIKFSTLVTFPAARSLEMQLFSHQIITVYANPFGESLIRPNQYSRHYVINYKSIHD